MFKWRIYISKKEWNNEEKIEKEFDDEKEFNSFIQNNPDLKKLQEFDWEPMKWSDSLAEIQKHFDKLEKEKDWDLLDRMKKEMEEYWEKSKKLLK